MLLKSILIASLLWIVADAARILGIFPYPSFSHQVVFRTLTVELARRGHELVIFTPNPLNDSTLQNYTEIDLHHYYKWYKIDVYSKKQLGIWSFLAEAYKFIEKTTDQTLSHPAMQQILLPNSTEKFDLIIVQALFYDALYGISFHFDTPLITVSSGQPAAGHYYALGNPLSIAYAPDVFTHFDQDMTLWQRFVNMYYYLRQILEYRFVILPSQERIRKKYFGDSVPPATQLFSRVSLFISNTHPFFSYSRPNVPEIIHIGGCRSVPQMKQLPQELEKILNDAKEGFIYFSMGSNVKSYLLPAEIRKKLLRTFAELPYKVLWKFESDYLPDKPDNVIIRKWLPQREVLAHPNIRLFIYQGGLQSTEDAIENAVPIIGFPIASDQVYNTKKMQSLGTGEILQIEVSAKILKETIFEVITKSSYKENMQKLRNLLQDLPYNPLDNAMWWIEHVIRHKGLSHLRTKSRDMYWYQTELLDIMAIIFGISILFTYGIIIIKRQIFKLNKQLMRKVKSKLINSIKKQQ